MWTITFNDDDDDEIYADSIVYGPVWLVLKQRVKVKLSLDKTKGFLWWKKQETITETKEELWPFCYVPTNRVKKIYWIDKTDVRGE